MWCNHFLFSYYHPPSPSHFVDGAFTLQTSLLSFTIIDLPIPLTVTALPTVTVLLQIILVTNHFSVLVASTTRHVLHIIHILHLPIVTIPPKTSANDLMMRTTMMKIAARTPRRSKKSTKAIMQMMPTRTTRTWRITLPVLRSRSEGSVLKIYFWCWQRGRLSKPMQEKRSKKGMYLCMIWVQTKDVYSPHLFSSDAQVFLCLLCDFCPPLPALLWISLLSSSEGQY